MKCLLLWCNDGTTSRMQVVGPFTSDKMYQDFIKKFPTSENYPRFSFVEAPIITPEKYDSLFRES